MKIIVAGKNGALDGEPIEIGEAIHIVKNGEAIMIEENKEKDEYIISHTDNSGGRGLAKLKYTGHSFEVVEYYEI